MEKKNKVIDFLEYSDIAELESADRQLVEAAIEARKTSYAPYSKFNVGAAVRLSDGQVILGSNQENAASPSGLCAERTAMFAAAAANPGVPMESIAIAGGPEGQLCEEPVSPCGACLQVMAEYQKIGRRPISILLYGSKRIFKFSRVDDMLPFIFTSLD